MVAKEIHIPSLFGVLWYTIQTFRTEVFSVISDPQPLVLVPDLDDLAEQNETQAKLQRLCEILDGLGSVVVAYSGGVDSAFLLSVAHRRLGTRAVGLTVVSPSLSQSELDDARHIAQHIGARHVLVDGYELENPDYVENSLERCYYCKTETFDLALDFAQREGIAAVADGTNADDTGDHRPGRKAGREHGVRSPLLEAGLTKAEIRALSKRAGLPSWHKPALACLASRVPYGTPISSGVLSQIEQAEATVRALGIDQLRVRHHRTGQNGEGGDLARIEVEPETFPRLLEHREDVVSALKRLGYAYVTLDLRGFRSGSLNEAVSERASEASEVAL